MLPCRATRSPTSPGRGDIRGPVDADGLSAAIGDRRQPLATALGEHDHRHRRPSASVGQAGHDALHVLEGELLVGRGAQTAAPGVEDLQRLGPGGNLGGEVISNRVGEQVSIRASAPAGRKPWSWPGRSPWKSRPRPCRWPGSRVSRTEADQGYGAVEFTADRTHRIHHISQVVLGADICSGPPDRPRLRTVFLKRGPSPVSKYRPSPSASGMVRMSENRIAASMG
jgi:hypothetical protein